MNLNEQSLEEFNKECEKSIKVYEMALSIDSSDIASLRGLAEIYKKQGKYALAVKYYTKIKHLTPFDKTVYYELGCLEAIQKNYIKAIKLFMNAIKLDSEYFMAIYAMGEAHVAIEEYEMAEMIYLKVLEKLPNDLVTYEKLANLYIKTSDYKKAINYFRDILAIDVSYNKAYYGLAVCFDKKGMKIEAKKYYKKYLNENPFAEEKNSIISRLYALKVNKTRQEADFSYLRLIK